MASEATGSRSRRLLALGLGLALGAALGELAARAVCRVDADGQVWIREHRVRPLRLPLRTLAARVAAASEGGLCRPDPGLGWTNRELFRSRDGSISIDAAGLRRAPLRPPGEAAVELRVAVFGDSFTFGDELADGETWAAFLQAALRGRGVGARVLNFGVNGYGLDQALLRWRRDGRPRRPDVVVLGFQPENLLRNLNVFRPLYFLDTSLPYAKPRFVLSGEGVEIVDRPTVPPEALPGVLAHFASQPLARYERFRPPATRAHLWQRSRLLALLWDRLAARPAPPAFALDPEMRELGLRIVRAFAREAREAGARFLIVHLPRQSEMRDLRHGRPPWHAAFLADLEREHEVVRPELSLSDAEAADFRPRGHYGPRLAAAVARSLVAPVRRAGRGSRRSRPSDEDARPGPAPAAVSPSASRASSRRARSARTAA